MSGWAIYSEISTSRRFNDLFKYEFGELAQVLYLIAYTHSDPWGHIPFDCESLRLKVLPGCPIDIRSDKHIMYSMASLVYVNLWDTPYQVGNNLYTHIWNFEKKCTASKRVRGKYPDESGVIPTRQKNENGKYISIEQSLADAERVREDSDLYVDLRSIEDFSTIYPEVCDFFESIGVSKNRDIKRVNTPAIAYPQIAMNGEILRSAFVGKLLQLLNGDMYELGKVLYRARNANDIYAYINKGIAEGFIWGASVSEDENPAQVKAWVEKLLGYSPNIIPIKPIKPGLSPIGDTIKDIIG